MPGKDYLESFEKMYGSTFTPSRFFLLLELKREIRNFPHMKIRQQKLSLSLFLRQNWTNWGRRAAAAGANQQGQYIGIPILKLSLLRRKAPVLPIYSLCLSVLLLHICQLLQFYG